MTKKEWAAWCHDYLLNTLHEPDETDWSAARALVDIYDCHTCVYHIAQVYVKGIIPARQVDGKLEFGGDSIVSKDESDLYLERLKNSEKRLPVPKQPAPKITKIDLSQIKNLENPLIFDVQNEQIFNSIRLNPVGVSSSFLQNIVLTCQRGYKSTLIADLLIKCGFVNVFVCINNNNAIK